MTFWILEDEERGNTTLCENCTLRAVNAACADSGNAPFCSVTEAVLMIGALTILAGVEEDPLLFIPAPYGACAECDTAPEPVAS